MDLRCPVRQWTKVIGLAVLVISVGCSQAVLLTHETEQGGVMTYLFKEDRGGPMGSPHRRDALKLIEGKCPSGYTIFKDGNCRDTAVCPAWKERKGKSADVVGEYSFGVSKFVRPKTGSSLGWLRYLES